MKFQPLERHKGLLALGLLYAFGALFFRDALRSRSFFWIDFHLTFQPLREIFGRALHLGLPTWNPHLSNGVPILSNPMHAPFYPLNWLFAYLRPAEGLTLLTLLHVFFGILGAWMVARNWGLTRVGAWTTALVFGFNGVAVSATVFTNLCWSWAWLPWLFLAWRHVSRSGGWRRVFAGMLFACVTLMMVLLGDPFAPAAGLVGILVFALTELSVSAGGQRTRTFVRGMVWPGLAGGVGLLLAAPTLVPALNYLPQSVRGAGFTWERATAWSLHPVHALEVLLPGAFGDAAIKGFNGLEGFWAQALVPDSGHPLFLGLYFGGIVTALVALGAFRSSKMRWPLVLWCGCLALLALGRYGPVYTLLLELPGFDALRFPVKWILPATLPVALLAGLGIDELARSASDYTSKLRCLVPFLVVLGVVALLCLAASPGLDGWLTNLAEEGVEHDAQARLLFRSVFLRAALHAAAPLAITVAFLFWSLRSARRLHPNIVVAVALTCDLFLVTSALAPTVDGSFYSSVPPAVVTIQGDPGGYGRVFVERPKADNPLYFIRKLRSSAERSRWRRETLEGYTAAAYGLDVAFNPDTEALNPVRYDQLKSLVGIAPLREKLMLLGAAGVTHIVSPARFESPLIHNVAVLPGLTQPPWRVYRNRLGLPRLRMVASLLPYSGDQGFVDAVATGPEDLFRRVALVEVGELEAHGLPVDAFAADVSAHSGRFAGEATLIADTGDRVQIRTRGPAGFLVISDSLVPGWNATVDGRSAPILLADYAFRAIGIPSGEHEVTLQYNPW